MTGTGLVALVWRYRLRVFLTGLIVAACAFGVTKFLPESYKSEGALLIKNPPSASGGDAANPAAVSNTTTQVDVLKSRGLIETVVRNLDLVHVPTVQPISRLPTVVEDLLATVTAEIKALKAMVASDPAGGVQTQFDATTAYVQQHLSVNNEENSDLITVGYQGGSPKTVADVTNGIMSAYLADIAKARLEGVATTEQWIASQKQDHQQAIVNAEKAVNEYARTHNVAEVQGSQNTAVQLSETQRQLVAARTRLANAEAAYTTAKLGKGGTEILESKTIIALKTQEGVINAEMGKYTPSDPRLAMSKAALAAVATQIALETNAIMASLARDVDMARNNLTAVEAQTSHDIAQAQTGSAAGTEFNQLKDRLTNERALYATFLTQATTSLVQAQQASTARIQFAAFEPERPSSTYGMMVLVLGFFCGIVGQCGFIVFRSMLRPLVTSREELIASTGLPVFASLPRVKARGTNILEAPKTASQVIETFRALGVMMHPIRKSADGDGKPVVEVNKGVVILVTSSDTKEGKTTVASYMAQRFATDGSHVLLIDGDMRHPSLAATLKVRPPDGLEALLQRNESLRLDDVIGHLSPHLDVLCSNGRMRNPLKVIDSEAFATIIAYARTKYDYVILDSPPLMHVKDAAILARYAQRVVFIVQSGRLTHDVVMEASNRFDEDDRDKIVTMLTRVPPKQLQKTDYYGGYGSRA